MKKSSNCQYVLVRRMERKRRVKNAVSNVCMGVWRIIKPHTTHSKIISYIIIGLDIYVTKSCIDIAYMAVMNGFDGYLPYVTAIVTFCQAATATILGFDYNKSKAENITGGINYEKMVSSQYAKEGSPEETEDLR